ncbi:MAG TPA: ThuA domain-containing protein [Verrucomicrobium sp.]|nr:ThuA domain-containing protein [Verrucomicrobium sp.]
MKRRFLLSSAAFAVALAAALPLISRAADAPKPLKVLLVTGGCCHDYAKQRLILAEGLGARANIEVEFAHTDDKSTKASFDIYNNADWAKGYDVVIHDECSADVKQQPYVDNILNAHKGGVPAVNLHCAMHSYRVGNFRDPVTSGSPDALWFDLIGLQSNGHGPQEPIALTFTDKEHPITKGLVDWTTIKEELYNNVKILTAHPLVSGKQTVKAKDGTAKDVETVVAWTNEYGPNKTRVFSTTIGHNNDTVSDARYLDLVTRGVLWSAGKLGPDGKALPGYEAKQK